MVVPNIPNNSLTEEIKEIVSLCQQLEDRYDSYFNPPASEEEIIAWENEHGITIPETYKDWLRFSNGSEIIMTPAPEEKKSAFELEWPDDEEEKWRYFIYGFIGEYDDDYRVIANGKEMGFETFAEIMHWE